MRTVEETVEETRKAISDEQLESLTRNPTLADLIRVGSAVTVQTSGWGNGQDTACALSAAYIGAKATGWA